MVMGGDDDSGGDGPEAGNKAIAVLWPQWQ